VEQVTGRHDTDTRRMELRGVVRLAGEVIAKYWPMRTFIHHNPLHGLEYLPFHEAVRRGQKFLGGRGYLSGATFRASLRSGRLSLRHLDEALKPLARDKAITFGSCRIAHREVLRACLTHGLCAATHEPLGALLYDVSNGEIIRLLARHLAAAVHDVPIEEQIASTVRTDVGALGHFLTLSQWCDSTLGTEIVAAVNGELIKWCEAFLDEGHATWPMPGREQGFYTAWKSLAAHERSPCGIDASKQKISALPERAEDAVLESLDILRIPEELRQDYLSLQLTALPGWAGFIKWREDQQSYAWQQVFPVSLVKYLAVRLWYVRELVQKACTEELGIAGRFDAIAGFMQEHPRVYFFRKELVAGRLPASFADQVSRLLRNGRDDWKSLANGLQIDTSPQRDKSLRFTAARRLLTLAHALDIVPTVLLEAAPKDLATLITWMDEFPESDHGAVWLSAFEAGYHDTLFGMLKTTAASAAGGSQRDLPAVRPQSQSVYCIDVRSEPFRRHLEATSANETYGFGGFFGVFIRYRAWGKEHDTEQFPVIMRARNEVREIPRSYFDHVVHRHKSRAKLVQAGHTLLHDLKENVVTPYVMVESLGWFYSLPIIGKTVFPAVYRRISSWLQRFFVPGLGTLVTVDKLSPAEIEEMLVSKQRAEIYKALGERLGLRGYRISPAFVEALRLQALNGDSDLETSVAGAAEGLHVSKDDLAKFVETLRREYRINQRWAWRKKEQLTRTGFTLDEQVLIVDTVLRMIGLTRNVARLVLFCAHGSSSENNPFESALDCGACGGNEGKPNARVLAAMANNPKVRERLAKTGLEIPTDTHFLAGQIDTTTDDVRLFDLEDVPPTHRKDVARLLDNLREAACLTSQERYGRFPEVRSVVSPHHAQARVQTRSADWSQVRPEWGLSGNTSFIIGRRELTKGLNLAGRVFLHSYDYREDPTSLLLEVILTGPQVVGQWINMEHYFSTVDTEVYGSGSKVYHNVVGRLGIISGPWSDLRSGLASQTVMNGQTPYHEPMRLLTVVEAPRANIDKLIGRHEVLQRFYRNEWVHLVAVDPEDRSLYRYRQDGHWRPLPSQNTVTSSQNVRKGVEE
jgi:uncharacterized protein YbcC (UPF0753/DUF2309 family)